MKFTLSKRIVWCAPTKANPSYNHAWFYWDSPPPRPTGVRYAPLDTPGRGCLPLEKKSAKSAAFRIAQIQSSVAITSRNRCPSPAQSPRQPALLAPIHSGNIAHICAITWAEMRERLNMKPKINGEIMQVDAAIASLQPEI